VWVLKMTDRAHTRSWLRDGHTRTRAHTHTRTHDAGAAVAESIESIETFRSSIVPSACDSSTRQYLRTRPVTVRPQARTSCPKCGTPSTRGPWVPAPRRFAEYSEYPVCASPRSHCLSAAIRAPVAPLAADVHACNRTQHASAGTRARALIRSRTRARAAAGCAHRVPGQDDRASATREERAHCLVHPRTPVLGVADHKQHLSARAGARAR
jgi:hypothetical protein